MRKLQVLFLLTVLLSICSLSLSGQFSIVYKNHQNQIEWQEEWKDHVSPNTLYEGSNYYGISYWLRLKNYRVEFHPTAYVTNSKQSIELYDQLTTEGSTFPEYSRATQNGFGLEVPIHFYFLDIEGDCNCPTFSKDGNFFTKGLYAYISPGVRRLGIEFAPNLQWDSLTDAVETAAGFEIVDTRNLRSLVLGVRLSFRPDYLRDKKAMYR